MLIYNIDPRRAIFTFENQKYRARLVDLPCIIEAQKTFNKVQYYKVADICQVIKFNVNNNF